MFTILIVLQILIASALIALVLIQHGKGADMGAAFGSGASGTVFGAQGSGSFLTKATAILGALFFINSLVLAVPAVSGRLKPESSVTDVIVPVEAPKQVGEEKAIPEEKISDLPDLPSEQPDLPE